MIASGHEPSEERREHAAAEHAPPRVHAAHELVESPHRERARSYDMHRGADPTRR